MWPEKSFDFIKLPDDDKGLHYGLFIEERLISVVSLFIEARTAQFRKFATLKEEQGKGYGTTLLRFLMDQAHQLDITKLWCNARKDKVHFYQAFGMRKTERDFSREGIDFTILEKEF